MSKRPAFPQYGDRKKIAKLDISHSEHHLPLSQNTSSGNQDEWGDDVDEEILLQASQACEEEQNDISMLPDYNNWKRPESTSTQYTSPSTSKSSFEFKKPSSNIPSSISTQLKNKCNTISSPLRGISTMTQNRITNLPHDLVVSDKIVHGHDTDMFRQKLVLEEQYNRLKSEYDKLSDKLVTKEGEASILRSQFKTLQVANDNLRMDKIRAQEQAQMEHNEKMAALNKEMQNLKTQLDFKDLEVVRVKEKFKLLEANKLRLTQINDISRNNNSLSAINGTSTQKRAKMTSNSVQTEDKAPFLKLNKSIGTGACGSSVTARGKIENEENEQLQLCSSVRQELLKLERDLEAAAFTSYQESDDRSLDKSVLFVSLIELNENRPLYTGERGAAARRATGALAAVLQSDSAVKRFMRYEQLCAKDQQPTILDTAIRICGLIERTTNGCLYSGFFKSLIALFESLNASDVLKPKILTMTKAVLLSKPMPFVTVELLAFADLVSSTNSYLPLWCPGSSDDAMDVDSTELCYFVLLLKQTEDCLSSIKKARKEDCGHSMLVVLSNLLQIFAFVYDKNKGVSTSRCVCVQRAASTLVRAYCHAVALLCPTHGRVSNAAWHELLLAACRSCTRQVYRCVVWDSEWVSRLQLGEGYLSDAVHRLHKHDPTTELSELKNTFGAAVEDAPGAVYLQRPLMDSFDNFSMTD